MSGKILFLTLLGCLSAACCTAQDLSLWKFDRLDFNGRIRDEAGRSNLTPAGDVEFRPGLEGNAVLINNGRPYFRTEDSDRLGLTNDFTIRAVVYPHNVRGYNVIAWRGDRSKKPEEVNYYLGIRDQKLEFKYKDDQGNWYVHTANHILKANEWYDISVHFNSGDVDVLINGDLYEIRKSEASTRGSLPQLHVSKGRFEVGEADGSSGSIAYARSSQFSGLIDEIRISRGRVMKMGASVKQRHNKLVAAFLKNMENYDSEVQQQREKEYQALFEKAGSRFLLKVLPTSKRINKGGDIAKKVQNLGHEITLYAARNEYESTQLLMLADSNSQLDEVKISISDLVSENGETLGSEHASWSWIQSVKINPDSVEAFPDIIMEGEESFAVNRGDYTPVLLRWYVPFEAQPGVYKGSVTVQADGFTAELPVTLNVWDFELPKKNSVKVAFTFFERYYQQWFGLSSLTDEQKLSIYEFQLRFRIPPNNIYARDLYPEYSLLKKIKDRTDFVTIGTWTINDSAPGAKEKRIERFRQSLQQLEELGLKEDVYFFGVDELEQDMAKRFPTAASAHEALHQEFPELKTMQTSFPRPEYEEFYNVWVPSMRYFTRPENLEKFESLRQKGDEMWWYLTSRPQYPFPQFFIDYSPFDSRIIMTLTYKQGVSGILYWAMNREWLTNLDIRDKWLNSEEAEWKPYLYHIHTKTMFNVYGIGNLIYPGREGALLPSLRLENLRDGIEDYEYLALLERLVKEQQEGELVEEARALLNVPAEVARAANDFNPDPSALLNYRQQVAKMIERLQGAKNE